jgi:hypothetical protein
MKVKLNIKTEILRFYQVKLIYTNVLQKQEDLRTLKVSILLKSL